MTCILQEQQLPEQSVVEVTLPLSGLPLISEQNILRKRKEKQNKTETVEKNIYSPDDWSTTGVAV